MTAHIIAVGVSSEGTEALCELLESLPPDAPGLVVAQHVPFVERLVTSVVVKEAAYGDVILPGRVLIAPPGRHILVRRCGTRLYTQVTNGPLVSGHRPSIDVLFCSVAQAAGENATAVRLTATDSDGVAGLAAMRDAGATIEVDVTQLFRVPGRHTAVYPRCEHASGEILIHDWR